MTADTATKNRDSLAGPPPLLSGKYETRLAQSPQEVFAAQQLRYRLMYAESGGKPDAAKIGMGADVDEWDDNAYHVIVLDKREPVARIVGNLRLVSSHSLNPGQEFYTEQSFDLTNLKAQYPFQLELGRFCIDTDKRQGAILLMIWKYMLQLIKLNEINLMLGCASFPGTDVASHQSILGYLYQHNLAPTNLMPKPKVIDPVSLAQFADIKDNFEDAARNVPTLLRGYLKLGARVSDTAVVDPTFNTTFVCIYVDANAMFDQDTPLVGTTGSTAT